MNPALLKQADFERWANDLAIQAITQAIEPGERPLLLIGHIVATYSIWLSRIKGEKPAIGAWDPLTVEQSRDQNEHNHSNWTAFLRGASEADLARAITFSFFGEASTMTVSDIITHSVNHGSYHRGQIIASLKGKLDPLPLTTYIAFARTAQG